MRKLPYIHSQGFFRYYTDHGPGHSEAVIKILDKLTEGVNLSEYENFLLKCGAWLHDIGMLMREGEDIDIKNPEVCNRIREEHHKRSAEYISKHLREIELSGKTEATIIQWICRAHSSKVDISKVPEKIHAASENVRTRLLAACSGSQMPLTAVRTDYLQKSTGVYHKSHKNLRKNTGNTK